jgi:transaldolase
MNDAIASARKTRNVEVIWASTREVFNVVEANAMGCHIITAPADVLKKLPALATKTAAELSLAAVKSFRMMRSQRGYGCQCLPRAAE